METMAADLVAGIPLADVSPWALVAMFVVLVATGRLIPRRTYDDKAHEADEWRAESRVKDQQSHELTEQNSAMLKAFGPTLTDFLQGLRRAAAIHDDDEVT